MKGGVFSGALEHPIRFHDAKGIRQEIQPKVYPSTFADCINEVTEDRRGDEVRDGDKHCDHSERRHKHARGKEIRHFGEDCLLPGAKPILVLVGCDRHSSTVTDLS